MQSMCRKSGAEYPGTKQGIPINAVPFELIRQLAGKRKRNISASLSAHNESGI